LKLFGEGEEIYSVASTENVDSEPALSLSNGTDRLRSEAPFSSVILSEARRHH
jgi:hypothetical protein